MRKTTLNESLIRKYWDRNKDTLKSKLIANNEGIISDITKRHPGQDVDEQLYRLFKGDVETFAEYDNLSTRAAIKKTVNTRAFKSQEEFYQESVYNEIKQNKQTYRELRNFFRDAQGKFTTITMPQYKGKVEINNVEYSKYAFSNNGAVIYYYTSQSPSSSNYSAFLTKENYA